MKTNDNIFLIGLMGAGKSTIGQLLAEHLGLDFYDLDVYLTDTLGRDIDIIFAKEGEAFFRAYEAKALKEMVNKQGIVLATGGGAVLNPANRALLAQHGQVVYLKARSDTLVERIKSTQGRPLLKNVDIKEKLAALMEVREVIYENLAHHIIETDDCSKNSIVHQILALL